MNFYLDIAITPTKTVLATPKNGILTAYNAQSVIGFDYTD